MKRATQILAVLGPALAVVIISTGVAFAYPTGWTSDVTVVASNVGSAVDIASRGSGVWVAYTSTADGNVHVRRSADRGVTWADATVSSDNGSWPAITATTSALYVAYVTSGGVEVYRSINAGSTWTRYAWITEAEGPTDAIANVSITDGTDTPAIAYYHRWWTEIPRKSTASWTSLGTGGDLTATKKSVGLDPNNDYEIPAIATDGSTIAIAYICRDYYGNEDTGIWVMRVNGCITTYDQILAGYSYESPDIAYQGGGVFAVVYVYASGGNRVYRKTWNGSSWSGSMYLYNATTQEPRPRAIAYGGGDAICRASNGADVVRATADVDPVLMQGVSPSSVSGSIAAACEGSSSYTYLAVASESGAITVKRSDSQSPTTSGVTVSGNTVQGITYANTNITVSFAGVVDDWNLSGTDPLGDAYTNGVSSVAVKYTDNPEATWGYLPPASGDNPIEKAPWQMTADVSDITDGHWYVKGVVRDTAGNTANSPIAHVILDRQLPTVSATVDTTESGDWRNKPTRVTITGSDTYLDHCEYRIDTGSWTRYTAPFAALQGQHNYGYRAVDLAGNSSGNSANLSLWVDSGSPSCQWDYPSGDIMQADRSDHVSLYATGADGTSGVSWIGLFVNGQKVAEADGNQQGCYWDVSSLPETTYTLTVKARDAAGNESTTTKTARLQKAQAVYGDTYFAEGTTRDGFDEYLCVLNPDQKNTASLTFSFQLETGQVITKSAAVPASSRSTFHVPDMVPAGHDVSTRIHSEGAFVIAERPMYFNYRGWTGGHTAVGINQLQQDYYFAEGTTRPGFDEWITLQNPSGSVATATVTYMLGTGENKDKTYTVPANTRVTVNVNADIGPGQDVSAKVHSDKPIAAERPMYFNYQNKWTGGQDVVGVTVPQQTWYFAEGTTRSGFDEWLCIQNPGASAANVTVNYSTGTAKRYSIAPHSRYTVNVNADVGADKDVSITVVSDQPVIAERPMYFNYNGLTGGSDVLGATETGVDFYFAEGTTRDGFSEYLTVLTTEGSGNVVYVSYLFPDGKTVNKEHKLRANRETINVNEDVGPDKDVAIRISTHPQVGNNFVVERPMYFNYRGWTGGSTVAGYSLY
jgi:hypothetical protein